MSSIVHNVFSDSGECLMSRFTPKDLSGRSASSQQFEADEMKIDSYFGRVMTMLNACNYPLYRIVNKSCTIIECAECLKKQKKKRRTSTSSYKYVKHQTTLLLNVWFCEEILILINGLRLMVIGYILNENMVRILKLMEIMLLKKCVNNLNINLLI